MAARKRRIFHDDRTREKIRTSQLINRLQDNALGKLELSAVQQRSAEILIRKTLPDLAAVQHSGDPENPVVTETIIRPQLTREEWLKLHKK